MKRFLANLVPPSGGQRFPALDGLRGVAALSVMVTHLAMRVQLDAAHHIPIAQFARLSVSVFFALSAFLLYYPVAAGKPFRTAEYLRRRAWRIYPAYLAALAFGAVVMLLRGHPIQPGNVLAHLTFSHTWFSDWWFSIVGPAWSMGTEVQFYLLLPVLVVALAGGRSTLILPLIALAAVAQVVSTNHPLYWRNLPECTLPFLCGMAVAQIVAGHTRFRWPLAATGGCIILALGLWAETRAGMLFGLTSPIHTLVLNPRGILACAGVTGLILGLAAQPNGLLHRALSSAPLRVCGVAGYGLFLLHDPLFALLTLRLGALPLILIGPPLAVAIGIASYLCIEAPAMRRCNSKQACRNLEEVNRVVNVESAKCTVCGAGSGGPIPRDDQYQIAHG